MPIQLAAIRETGDAIDIVSRKEASRLDPEIIDGHELQFEFLVDRPVVARRLGKSSGCLGLEFAFAGATDIGTNQKAKDMLGVDVFSMHAGRNER